MEKLKILKKILRHIFVFAFYSLLFYGGIFLGGMYIFHLTNPKDPFAAFGALILTILFFAFPSIIIATVSTYFILKKIGYDKKAAINLILFYFIITLLLFIASMTIPVYT